MFTGLIETIGKVKNISSNKEGKLLTIESHLAQELEIDHSVSVNGACQTVIKKTENTFDVQAVHITLEKTTLGSLNSGDKVNLELAMLANARLGGHMVQGHVNGVGELKAVKEIGKNWEIWFSIPEGQEKYVVKEGSICIDGISLTVADLRQGELMVTIIPHTYENTTLHNKSVGSKVNIEVDILGKYIERLITPYLKNSSLNKDFLSSRGFDV